jgi:hypothetical protein
VSPLKPSRGRRPLCMGIVMLLPVQWVCYSDLKEGRRHMMAIDFNQVRNDTRQGTR